MIRIQNSVILSHGDVCYSFLRPIMSSSSGTIKWMDDYISDIQHLSKRHMERLAGMQNTVASHNVPTYGKKLMERMGWAEYVVCYFPNLAVEKDLERMVVELRAVLL